MNLRVYLMARPEIDWNQVQLFLADHATEWRRIEPTSDAERLVELAGRVCYFSFGASQSPRSAEEYIANLINKGHESVLEHATWTFAIVGVSRAFTHQMVRHRVGFAFSQLSQQYHDESEADFIEPPELKDYPELSSTWREAIATSKEAYRTLLRALERVGPNRHRGLRQTELVRAIRSVARSVLPNATETKIVVTANARALRHFLKVRGAIEGDLEMRLVAAELLRKVTSDAPLLFGDFRIDYLADGTPIVLYEDTVPAQV